MIRVLILLVLLGGCLSTPPERPADDDDSSGSDDDDSVTDDDDDDSSVGDDDLVSGDDDIGPDSPDSPRAGLCAAAGRAINDTYDAVLCTGPVDIGPGISNNDQYQLITGTLSLVTSPEKKD
jgi:hypothetical protein